MNSRILKINVTPAIARTFLKNIIPKRHYSCENVRVRFAPSPTGLLHLGGLRTALYNHLFAISQNGITILRIEDTDQTRKLDSAVESLIKDLEWCGITFDEGPYYQSERISLYKKHAEQLINEGKAYYCFCSKLRLDLLRKEAIKLGENPKYDNICRNLTEDEINEKLGNGDVPCIRFKLSPLLEPIHDLIQDPYVYNVVTMEGDPVILKADGFPTYHFANVLDDHLMNISHVLRGVEWQVSTPKHILLFKAFNWKPPLYGHIPLLLNPDGTKLSKRKGDINIQDLRSKGYFPNAILNFLVRHGGGFNFIEEERHKYLFTMNELCEKFDISGIKQSNSKIKIDLLDHYNKLEMNRQFSTDKGLNEMVKYAQEVVTAYFTEKGIEEKPYLESDHIKVVLKKIKDRINKVDELVTDDFIFLWYWNDDFSFANNEDIEIMEKFLSEADGIKWHMDELKQFLRIFSKKNGKNFPDLMKLMRVLLIGKQNGPSVPEILDILGKETIYFRISKAIQKSKNGG